MNGATFAERSEEAFQTTLRKPILAMDWYVAPSVKSSLRLSDHVLLPGVDLRVAAHPWLVRECPIRIHAFQELYLDDETGTC